jgi:hypothetical protein
VTIVQLSRSATPVQPHGPGVTLWLLRAPLSVHALAAVGQPVLAGRYLSGDFDALTGHAVNASLVLLTVMAAFPAAVLYWLVGRGAGWPALALAALFVAEVTQIAVGAQRVLAVHIPLGVGIVGTTVALVAWSFRPAARRPRNWRTPSAPGVAR